MDVAAAFEWLSNISVFELMTWHLSSCRLDFDCLVTKVRHVYYTIFRVVKWYNLQGKNPLEVSLSRHNQH